MTFGELAFGELTFGKMTFGELAFGELTFGKMTFGKLSGHPSISLSGGLPRLALVDLLTGSPLICKLSPVFFNTFVVSSSGILTLSSGSIASNVSSGFCSSAVVGCHMWVLFYKNYISADVNSVCSRI
jgi:hypothetical protein